MNNRFIRLAACQPPDVIADKSKSASTMLRYAEKAQLDGASLVCFPECYLQGYVVQLERSKELAIALDSDAFATILLQLSRIEITIVFGMIEIADEKLFNTAVVVKNGRLVGSYRKVQLTPGETKVFSPGSEFPVFDLSGIKFGMNICNDLNFSECALQVADQGAQLLVCPCNNMHRLQVAVEWKEKHNRIRSLRCQESGLWLLSSDVTGEREDRISYGPTAVINPAGEVVAQAELEKPGMILHNIAIALV